MEPRPASPTHGCPNMSSPRPTPDRNLLVGLLAFQNGFVGRDPLLAAMSARALEKGPSLGEVLLRQGLLAEPDLQLLERLVDRHLARDGEALGCLPHGDVHDLLHSIKTTPLTPPLPTAGPARRPAAPMRYRALRPHARGGFGLVS